MLLKRTGYETSDSVSGSVKTSPYYLNSYSSPSRDESRRAQVNTIHIPHTHLCHSAVFIYLKNVLWLTVDREPNYQDVLYSAK